MVKDKKKLSFTGTWIKNKKCIEIIKVKKLPKFYSICANQNSNYQLQFSLSFLISEFELGFSKKQ